MRTYSTADRQVLGKAEWMNPGGSVKDRAALFLVKRAEERGTLKPGGTVVEGTAGEARRRMRVFTTIDMIKIELVNT